MAKEKYGFIYLWYDRKHKRFYLGRHWGTETDGYICSSNKMRDAYSRRPNDFKRRIVSRIYSAKEDLVIEEQRWLDMISSKELNEKYYNKTKSATTPSTKGYNHTEETREKIRKGNIGKKHTEETKEKLREANRKQFEDQEQREMRRQKSLELWSNPEYRKTNTENKKGKKQSEEQIKKRIQSNIERWMTQPKKGVPRTEAQRKRQSEISRNMIWINNGFINKRISSQIEIPDGFIKGRLKNNG